MREAKPKIGYIGIGLMGGPMALRLVAAGYEVAVWGRNPEKVQPVVDAGARWAESAAEVAQTSDITFTCVSDTQAVEAVVFRAGGIAEGGAAGKLLVDTSSMRPDATIEMAARLREETGGMGWLDAPVSGGVIGAETGQLVVMCGGEQADFDRAAPVIEHLAQRATLMGPTGAGQTTKLINQLLVGCTITMIAEATRLALEAGVDVAKIPPALAGGRADSRPLQEWMVRMASGDDSVESHLRTMLKDLETVLDLGRATEAPLPMTELAAGIHRTLAERGLAEADGTAVFRYYDKNGPA